MSIGVAGFVALGSGALAAGGAIAGGEAARGGAVAAGQAQLQAQRESIAAQTRQSEEALKFLREQAAISREELAPLREIQVGALEQLRGLATPGSPLEQAQRTQATTQIQRQLAAQGLLRSGTQVQGLTNLELGLAQQRQNILAGLAGTGGAQGLAGIAGQLGAGQAQIATGLGQQIGTSLGQQGRILGQQALGGAAATQAQIGGVTSALGATLGAFAPPSQFQQALISALGGGGQFSPSQVANQFEFAGLAGIPGGTFTGF